MTNEKLLDALTAIVGHDNVLTAEADMASYLIDWRGRYRGLARCVVRPRATNEVAEVVRACAAAGAPIVPQGGNTSHCGAGIPDTTGRAVLLSLSRMNAIRAIDAANGTITVEAGCVLQTVRDAAAVAGLLFPLSLAAEGSCQIGGNLAANAGGVQVLRYGNARELTLGMEAVLPDGRVWDGLRGLRKDNTGYDLKHLFIGSEGTLGIITAAVLKLFPLPRARATAWLAIDSAHVATRLLGELQAAFGTALSACELISHIALALVEKHIHGARAPLAASPWHLLIELSGPGEDDALRASLEGFLENALEGEVSDAVVAQSSEQAGRLWALRERISEAQKIEGVSIKHDISVPVSRIGEFLDRADAALTAAWPGIRIVAFGHVGDGNLHYNQSKPEAGENAEFIARTPEVNRLVHDIVHTLGGSISAEHGIGQLKRDEMRRYKSAVELDLMRAVKNALDPQGILNPGKVL